MSEDAAVASPALIESLKEMAETEAELRRQLESGDVSSPAEVEQLQQEIAALTAKQLAAQEQASQVIAGDEAD